jgi:Immunoglobulin I-set domain/Immunoglobulin domain
MKLKLKVTNFLALTLAGILQFMPLLRSALPIIQSSGSPTGALILRWVAGGVAYFGYHAISSASSISISPPSATIGVPYAGTVTFSSGYSAGASAMNMSNVCLGSYILSPGLTLTYNGGHTATVTGTPTSGFGSVPFALTVYEYSGCGGLSYFGGTSLVIQNSGGGPVTPSMLVPPQNIVAQVGSDVILSGGASGNPTPQYYWQQGLTPIPGATNNTLLIPAAQLTNAGIYTLNATNSSGKASSTCYLTMAITPGSNILVSGFTNYIVAGTPLTMSSLITNVPAATNTYSWAYASIGGGSSPIPGATNKTLVLTSAQTIPSKSGTYSVTFNSVDGFPIVNLDQYNSYWVFGYLPSITSQPTGQTVGAGSNVTFNITLTGSTYPNVFLYQNQTNLVAQTNLSTFNPSSGTTTTTVSMTISNLTQANAGMYTFVVTNFWGSTTSSNASLTVTPSLSVTAPQSQTNYAGKNVSLNVTATGTAPISYYWQKGGVNLSNGGAISGATTNTLSIAPAATNNSGNYQVIATNSSGSVTSSVAVLSIVPVPQFALSVSNNATLSASGGVAGSNYVVQVSTNLANTNGWLPLKTNVVPPNGSITFTDTNSSNSGRRFYRVQFP